jgi:NAD(P)-dependent dehydrogenase (short-subunit alcohol dehydrogenase family)
MPPGGRLPFREARLSDWEKVVDIDLTGPFRVTQAALPLLDKAVKLGGSARVINIASVAGVLPLQLQAAYSSAKSGLISLTQSMALELGKEGILCNAIAPGTIATDGTAQLWGKMGTTADGKTVFKTEDAGTAGKDSFAGRDNAQRHMDMIALGRPGVPNDIAQGILFLCASNYTNGHTLVIDGAWSICIRPF